MTAPATSRRLAAALLATVASLSQPAQAAVEMLTVETPRQFGYVIGDEIEHRVSLALRPGFELDPASVPVPGRITRWLSLNEAVLDGEPRDGASRYDIELRYQVVNAGSNVVGAGTPPVSLRVFGAEDDLPVVIPAWGFTIGPIVKAEERPPGTLPELRPAQPPAPIATATRTARVIALGLLAAALATFVAWPHVRERIGWMARGPFNHACRQLERRMKNVHAPGAYADALVAVHAAFNTTAGRAVFAHDLSRFFTEHPRFEPLRKPIEALFAESSELFYGDGGAPASTGQSLERLRDLCRACRDAERRR